MMMKKIFVLMAALAGFTAVAANYDLNGDGVVDRADNTLLVTRIADQAVYNSQFDLDGNGTVDVLDANLLLEELDKPQPVSTQTFTVNGVSFTMVGVQGGTFTMGATAEQGSDAYDWEKPAHQVTLSSFSIGQTEVTQALWVAVMGSNPSWFNGYGNSDYGSYHSSYDYGTNLQRPVEWVSWDDCQEFITKLNQLTGKQFRLPTEAEWEYAARGGNRSKGYKYAGSNSVGDVAWYWDNIPSQSSGTSGYGTQTVGTKQANELGLYDMSGNVLEWCQDWYGSYSSDAQNNPTGPSSGSYRVYRGGSWGPDARCCRVSARYYDAPEYRSNYDGLGFRLAQ